MSQNMTRNHYTDFVKHSIRFYITCPDQLDVAGHTAAEVNNWIAVQTVFADLEPEERRFVTDVYRRNKVDFVEAVRTCCKTHEMSENDAWKLLSSVVARIARVRGLV